MKTRLPGTLGRFAALFLVVGAFACGDGETKPEPPSNQPPVALGDIPPQTLFEGDEFQGSVDALFSDPDGDALTYSATSSNSGVVTASMSGSIITVEAVAEGTATVTVTATDPDGASASLSVSFTVLGRNESPVVTDTIPPQNLTEGDTVTLDVSGNFSDPDGDELTFTVESTNTNAATATIDGSVVTIIAVAEGMAIVAVTATDPDDAFALQEVMVTVEAANRAPVAVGTIPDAGLAVGEEFTAPVVQFFSDPDGDELTYAAVSGDTMVVTASMAGSLITVVGVGAGETTIMVTATDPEGLSATQTANFTVTAVNQAPVLTDTIPHQDLAVGGTVTLDVSGTFTDPDGDTLTLTVESEDTTVATASLDGTMLTLVGIDVGTSFVSLTATDPGGLSATQVFAAFVASGNQAPMAEGEIPAQNLKVGDSASVDVSGNFSDPDDDELIYMAASSDEAVATVSVSGAEVTVTGVAAGSATVTVTATDPGDLSATQTFDVTVTMANQGPEAVDTIPVHDLLFVTGTEEDDTMTTVVLDMAAYFSDPDGDELVYTASSSDDAIAIVGSVDGSVVTTVAVSSDTSFAHDTTMLTVTATDPDGEAVSQEAVVLVANSDYELWDLIVINDDGRITFGGFVILGECIPVLVFPYDGTVYTAHWTTWQVKKGTGWVNLPGTYRALEICPNFDLPNAPAGTYRVVGRTHHLPVGWRSRNRVRPQPPQIRGLRQDQQLTRSTRAGAGPHTRPRLTPAHKTAPPPPSRRSRRGYSAPASAPTSTVRPPSAPTARPPTRSGPAPCPRAASAR